MKVHRLAVWFLLPMLAGCTRLSQQPITPPAGLNAQQKVAWSTSKCVRMVKEKRPWLDKIFPCKCAWSNYYVTIISPDGTALASFHDATWKSGSFFKQQPKAAREIYTERALKTQYLLQAVNGRRYPYHVTALAADCESAILKPVKPIPRQPYLDISRMAVPQLGQSYRGVVDLSGTDQPLPFKLGTITVGGVSETPASTSINTLFRAVDGSFIGFCSRTRTGYVTGNKLVPLQKFISANSPVRFTNPVEKQPPILNTLYQRLQAQAPPRIKFYGMDGQRKIEYSALLIRSDGLVLDEPLGVDTEKPETRIGVWNGREHVMRFVRIDPLLDGALWMPVERTQVRELILGQATQPKFRSGDRLYTVDCYGRGDVAVVTQCKVASIDQHGVVLQDDAVDKCWIFTADGKLIGFTIPVPGKPILMPLSRLQQLLSTAK